MTDNTMLTESFLASLPERSEQQDVLDRATVAAWADQVAGEGGYAPELAPVIERVPGPLIAQQFTLSWPKALATFGELEETAQRVAALAFALAELARQFEALVPKRVAIPASALLTGAEKSAAVRRIQAHADNLIAAFVADGVRREVAEAVVTETAMITPATFAALLDIARPTEALWRSKGAVPPFHKNPGRAGIVRYPLRTLVPWLVESFDYRFEVKAGGDQQAPTYQAQQEHYAAGFPDTRYDSHSEQAERAYNQEQG